MWGAAERGGAFWPHSQGPRCHLESQSWGPCPTLGTLSLGPTVILSAHSDFIFPYQNFPTSLNFSVPEFLLGRVSLFIFHMWLVSFTPTASVPPTELAPNLRWHCRPPGPDFCFSLLGHPQPELTFILLHVEILTVYILPRPSPPCHGSTSSVIVAWVNGSLLYSVTTYSALHLQPVNQPCQ